ncbi:conserved hypothetical protein [Ricinus communis]|uniref:Uncharacterized protein n=1 Tax=Ricinus communis TaxID=3988 RepID=B9SBA3_RICCO|nr:conserved hypothetical protein [Ricinus communis]
MSGKSRMNYECGGNATAAAARSVNLPPIREAPPPGPAVQAAQAAAHASTQALTEASA